MSKIVVGMSGGVDSAVTAYLLKAAGHDVIGVTLKTWSGADGSDGGCCEISDARRVAQALDIPFYTVHCESEFRECVVMPFVEDYLAGRTPNPCVVCNRTLKFSKMIEAADTFGAQYIATGHYAEIVRLENGRLAVKNAEFADKDQTYMLYRLTQEQLARTLMPLGRLPKSEVRAIAGKAGLPVANKPDSQEICFVTSGSYADFIEENAEGFEPRPGSFVDENGTVLGEHKGIIHYTVGQRKGLGVAFGKPMYVKRIDAPGNKVVLAPDSALYSGCVTADCLNFQSIPDLPEGETIAATVRIRYRHAGERAVITRCGGCVNIEFEKPVRAPAPGQSAVFYDEHGCVIGGGRIVG